MEEDFLLDFGDQLILFFLFFNFSLIVVVYLDFIFDILDLEEIFIWLIFLLQERVELELYGRVFLD